ncbi:MAG TPA: hypothetical protein PKD83_14440 [Ignavibacteria bacterium]|nr:hypothetical protein [Ignavibacteria bacterium]
MKKIVFLFVTFVMLNSINSFAQSDFHFKLNSDELINPYQKLHFHSKEKSEFSNGFLEAVLIVFPFNPIFQLQNKRFYAGITKEVSLMAYPYGRLAVEYSLIFRETRLNQFRASYNFDFGLESGDLYAFLFSIGGGYFTDFHDVGYFPQASVSLILPFGDNLATVPYFKVRETFMTKGSPDIFDVSLGLGLYITF